MNFHRMNPIDSPAHAADEARVDYFDQTHPYWREAVNPDRYVREDDMPVYDTRADESRVPNEDWDAMAEDFWNDDKFM